MNFELLSASHSVGEANYHFQPQAERDHCYVFITNCKNHSPVQVAKLLKGVLSRMMRKHNRAYFKNRLYGRKFWSSGYFYRTVGAVYSETVRHYVEVSQDKHWVLAEQKAESTAR